MTLGTMRRLIFLCSALCGGLALHCFSVGDWGVGAWNMVMTAWNLDNLRKVVKLERDLMGGPTDD